MNNITLNLKIPAKMKFLFKKGKRYKIAYGGRGSGKSWSIARALIIMAYQSKLRILCAREIQESLEDSVHLLLTDQIKLLGLSAAFTITKNCITGINGSMFIYEGLRNNDNAIRSKEGIDICWVEEAEAVTDESLDVLIPTIRKDNCEIWFSFNPGTEYDPVYQRFVKTPREDTEAVEVNFFDNPWFPEPLRMEMEWDKAHDKQKYEHVWLGKPTGYAGKIYPLYDSNIHGITRPHKYDIASGFLKNCNCYMSIDPHRKYYPFIIWVAITLDNKFVVYNEFPTRSMMGGKLYHEVRNTVPLDLTPAQVAGAIHVLDCGMYGAKIIKRSIDPRFATENPEYITQLGLHGITGFQIPDHEFIDSGRERVRKLIEYNTDMGIIAGYNDPDLVVMDHCENVDAAFNGHCWEAKDKKLTGDGVESERHKDPIDAIRYLTAITDCKYISDKKAEPIKTNQITENDLLLSLKRASIN